MLAFLIVPTLIVIPMSFSESQYLEFPPREWSLRWYRSYFASSAWMQATVTSFQAGALTTLFATPLGTLAAYGLFVSRFRWVRLIHVLLITPIIVPVILVAIAVFYVYVKLRIVNSRTVSASATRSAAYRSSTSSAYAAAPPACSLMATIGAPSVIWWATPTGASNTCSS